MTTLDWLDFNDAEDPLADIDVAVLKTTLLDRIDAVLTYLLPAGKVRGHQFIVGDLDGHPGKSLVVEMAGARAGMWLDFATGDGGDILALWARVMKLDASHHFVELVAAIRQWLGTAPVSSARKPAVLTHTAASMSGRPTVIDDLGPVTAKWDYHDVNGRLIACVYRYDPPSGKEYRPWDVRTRSVRAPDPRPLYQQPALQPVRDVILVEGEKAADALVQAGYVATTAMNGAQAPVDKTDWSPLAGKQVLIWPDHDAPGVAYAQRAAEAIVQAGASTVAILTIPGDKPPKWDADDAVADGLDLAAFLRDCERTMVRAHPFLPVFSLADLLADTSPMPEDLIAPRVLTPGGMVVLGGAPKVGKSDFLLSWLTHMAAGEPFLTLTPARPLRVFYLQAEVQYHYLRERIQAMGLPAHVLKKAQHNLLVTPQLRLVLNDAGVAQVTTTLQQAMTQGGIDVLVIDPIRNVFDGGEEGHSENDNNAMLFFLRERVERLRDAVNPSAGIILAHHTKKISKKQIEEDPFLALSGAGSLRGYYTTGMLLYRPDETMSDRTLVFELRNGPGLANKCIDKQDGQWVERDPLHDRLVRQHYGAQLDAERRRKHDVIVQLIFDEAQCGHIYTATQFAEAFEGRAGLGAERTIRERIGVLATQGYIKFFRNPQDYGRPPLARTRYGYLCVEAMTLLGPDQVDTDTGEVTRPLLSIKPTHYKCPETGATLPVEHADVWVYHEESTYEHSA